jgi:RHS repeat-associated protein
VGQNQVADPDQPWVRFKAPLTVLVRDAVETMAAWRPVGRGDDIIAMAASDGKLFAVTKDGRLVSRDAVAAPVATPPEWQQMGPAAADTVALAAADGILFAADQAGRLHVREVTGPDNWIRIPIDESRKFVAMTAADGPLPDDGRLFAVDIDPNAASPAYRSRLLVGKADRTTGPVWDAVGLAGDAVALAAAGGKLFLATPSGGLYAPFPSPDEYLFDVFYERSADGHITRTHSNSSKLNASYQYDHLNRLLGSEGDVTDSFTYDDLGNITSNGRNPGAYTYPPSGPDGCGPDRPCARPHAVKSVGAAAYTYDANGNTTSRGGREIAWDADNRPIAMQNFDAGWTNFAYDAAGQRVTKESGDKKTFYYGPLIEYSNHLTKYYYAGSRLVARSGLRTPPHSTYDTYWHHPDHLGSVRLMTSWHGWPHTRYGYTAFGQRSTEIADPAGDLANGIGFTGLRHDEKTGLIYMNARYYDPQLARFISPDALMTSTLDPQAVNPYSYVNNNPLSYVDPTGYDPVPVEVPHFLYNATTRLGQAELVQPRWQWWPLGFTDKFDYKLDLFSRSISGPGGGFAIRLAGASGIDYNEIPVMLKDSPS